MNDQPRPPRVVVTRRQPRIIGTGRSAHIAIDIDRHTEVGEVYMRALMRAQLRLGLLVTGAIVGPLVALPLLFVAVPGMNSLHVVGLPLPWFLLGVVIYPLLLAASYWYVRHVERDERSFVELVEKS